MEMAWGSEAFIALAAVVLLTSQTVELRHDHLWRSGSGTLHVSETGVTWAEPKEPKHNRTWSWIDIQQLELTSQSIRILTYEDAKWRGYRDREYLLNGLPAGFAESISPLLRDRLREKFIGTLAFEPSDAIWTIPVKLRQGLGGSEGELIFSTGLLTYSSPEKAQSRSWPLEQIEMISSSGRYELTVLPHEQDGWTRGRREYNFQLKRPLGEDDYQQLWMSIQTANGLVSNATGRRKDSSNRETRP
jgi:hypothetical protein